VSDIPRVEWAIGLSAAIALQMAFVVAVARRDPPVAAASEPAAVAVAIVPVLDEERLPALKYGSKKPSALPDMWRKPRPAQKKPLPANDPSPASTTADPTEKTADLESDAGPPPATTSSGAPEGVSSGTETDPLKAQHVSLYRAQLRAWFQGRFAIRGKVPFERLKTLLATATVQIDGARRVGGYTIKGSGDAVFDGEVDHTLATARASGAELPPPPDQYPDVLGSSLVVTFQCTVASLCE